MKTQEAMVLDLFEKKMKAVRNMKGHTVSIGNKKGRQGIEMKKDSIQDVLCIAVDNVLSAIGKGEVIEDIERYFNKACRNVTIDKARKHNTSEKYIEFGLTDAFETENMTCDEKAEYTKNLMETIEYIESNLKNDTEKKLFRWYHVESRSMQEISDILDTNKMQVSRMIAKINAKLHKMQIKELYRVDMVAPSLMQDKKMVTGWHEYKPGERVFKSKILKKKVRIGEKVESKKREGKVKALNGTAFVYESRSIPIADYKALRKPRKNLTGIGAMVALKKDYYRHTEAING